MPLLLIGLEANDIFSLTEQPCSQALSPPLPFVFGRKSLVVAGHLTTQNLGGKKICWVGEVA